MQKGCYVYKALSSHVNNRLEYVFGSKHKKTISDSVEMLDTVITGDNLEENKSFLKDVEVMFSTWGMVSFTEEELKEYFPKLQVLFYAAGSVQAFARPFLNRGIKVVSAWGAMCDSVAEFTVASIIFLNKGSFFAMQDYAVGEPYLVAKERSQTYFPGTYETKVGVLGAGMIGSKVVELLKSYSVELMVFDIDQSKKDILGLERLYSMEEIFSECQVISNHIADNEHTRGILNYDLFKRMKPTGAFINTGRGAQVVEPDLARALKEEKNRFALLDVTWPEPMETDCSLKGLPNCMIFPHIAGYANQEVYRMTDCILEQFHKYLSSKKMDYEVSLDMLKTMA